MIAQSYIPVRLQQDLDARISAAGGDSEKVRREVEAEVEALEARSIAGSQDVMVSLLRGELLYLESVIRAANNSEVHTAPSLWQRIRNTFKGNKTSQ